MYPLFLCACSASYLSSLASNTQSKMADRFLTTGETCRACAVDFFARPREKKWVHENVTFASSVIPLYDLSSVVISSQLLSSLKQLWFSLDWSTRAAEKFSCKLSLLNSFDQGFNFCFSKLKSDLKSTNIDELRIQMETYYEETQRLQTVLSSVYSQVPGTRNVPDAR